MFRSLSTGAIGVKVSGLEEGLELAGRHGFEGYHFDIREVARLGVERVRELVAARGVRLSAWGFPVDFRGEQGRWQEHLEELPGLAGAAEALGVRRTATWISPASDERDYAENFRFHAARLRPAAEILAAHGICLGLEYVGPKTSQTGKKYPFARTMAQMGELCVAAGENVGFLLDSWHWYTAEESAEDLRRLSAEQVVDVHVNDAPAGLAVDAQVDNRRTLPGETGVIDIAAFLGTLREIGYDGPVMVEPFSEKVRNMDRDAACRTTSEALGRVWKQAGL